MTTGPIGMHASHCTTTASLNPPIEAWNIASWLPKPWWPTIFHYSCRLSPRRGYIQLKHWMALTDSLADGKHTWLLSGRQLNRGFNIVSHWKCKKEKEIKLAWTPSFNQPKMGTKKMSWGSEGSWILTECRMVYKNMVASKICPI